MLSRCLVDKPAGQVQVVRRRELRLPLKAQVTQGHASGTERSRGNDSRAACRGRSRHRALPLSCPEEWEAAQAGRSRGLSPLAHLPPHGGDEVENKGARSPHHAVGTRDAPRLGRSCAGGSRTGGAASCADKEAMPFSASLLEDTLWPTVGGRPRTVEKVRF